MCACVHRADDGSQFTHLIAQSTESTQRPQQPLLQEEREDEQQRVGKRTRKKMRSSRRNAEEENEKEKGTRWWMGKRKGEK